MPALQKGDGDMTIVRCKPIQHEHYIQAAFFRWAALAGGKYPEIKALFAIPNGGTRHKLEAVKLKREGVKAGVPDVCLPVPRGKYAGLWIEFKAEKGKVTEHQDEWHILLRSLGHRVEVSRSWQAAVNIVEKYLQGIDW